MRKNLFVWLTSFLLLGVLAACTKDVEIEKPQPFRPETLLVGNKTWYSKSNFVMHKSKSDSVHRLRIGAYVPDYNHAWLGINFLETSIPLTNKTYRIDTTLTERSGTDAVQIRFFYPETMNVYYAASGQVTIKTVGNAKEIAFNNLVCYCDSNRTSVTLSYWTSIPMHEKVSFISEL